MNKIQCSFCKNTLEQVNGEACPEYCPRCGRNFEDNDAAALPDRSIRLIFQKTGHVIDLPRLQRIVVTRNHFDDLDVDPRLFSRSHCEFRWDRGVYRLSDLGSTNGTFHGLSKIDCLDNPAQPIQDDDVIMLGNLVFTINLVGGDEVIEHDSCDQVLTDTETNDDDTVATTTIYICRGIGCGFRSTEIFAYCPECGKYFGD